MSFLGLVLAIGIQRLSFLGNLITFLGWVLNPFGNSSVEQNQP